MGGCLSHHFRDDSSTAVLYNFNLLFKLIVYLDFVHDTFLPKHLKLYKPTTLSRLGTGCKSFDQKKKKNMKMETFFLCIQHLPPLLLYIPLAYT